MLTKEELESRVAKANEAFVSGQEAQNVPPKPKNEEKGEPVWSPIDLYQHNRNKQRINAKKQFPKGSRAVVLAAAKDVAERLACHKAKTEDDIESIKATGDKQRADILARQYMEERFIPAIETVINYSSPDELLNCREALAVLDDLAIGAGSMRGYTSAYVRQAYGNLLGQIQGGSDPTVKTEVSRIKSLVESDQIRTAIGLAQKLKKKIDSGEGMASPEDYAIIGRIVAYAN